MDRLQVVTRGGLKGVGQQYFSPSAYHAKWAEHPGPCSDSYLLTHRSHRTHSTWRALWTLQQEKKRKEMSHHPSLGNRMLEDIQVLLQNRLLPLLVALH